MISRVRGRLIRSELGRAEVMTEAGVGYEVHVPASLYDRLPDEGEIVELHTALVVRDTALELFGFPAAEDRELFLRLQQASGVGPRLALSLLGELPGQRIVRAIQGKDHDVLRTVSGVGRKTAEKIAVELADKLDDLTYGERAAEPSAAGSSAVQALRALGYGAQESEEAVHRARKGLDGREVDTEELVRLALQHV